MDLKTSLLDKDQENLESKNIQIGKLDTLESQYKPLDTNDSSPNAIQNKYSDIEHSRRNDIIWTIVAITWILCATLAVAFCKIVYINNPDLTGFDYLFVRTLTMMSLAISNVVYLKVDIFGIEPKYRLLMLVRCLIGGLGMPCFFLGLKYIASSKAALISNMNPLIVTVLSYFILKEAVKVSNVVALLGAFIGVTLFSINQNGSVHASNHYILGISLVFVSCCCKSTVAILLRKLNQQVHYLLSPFFFGMTTATAALALLVLQPSVYNFKAFTSNDVLLFMLSGVCTYVGQVSKSLALKLGNASYVTPFSYIQVVLLLICDLMLFGYEFMTTDYLGVALTFICVLFPVIQKLSKSKKPQLEK